MTMLERIAREMREKYNAEFGGGGELVPFEEAKARDAWLSCAFAAVRAMREPNGEMVNAAFSKANVPAFDFWASWKAGIDAILTEAIGDDKD